MGRERERGSTVMAWALGARFLGTVIAEVAVRGCGQ